MLILLLAEPLVNGYEYVGPYSVLFEFKFYCNIVLVSLPRIPEDVMSPLFLLTASTCASVILICVN